MIWWIRHSLDLQWHALASADLHHSFRTQCNGGWSASDGAFMASGAGVPEDDRCKACMDIVIDPVERGLAELCAAELGGEGGVE